MSTPADPSTHLPLAEVQPHLDTLTGYAIQGEQLVAAATVAALQQPLLYPTILQAVDHHQQVIKNARDALRIAVAIGEVIGKVPVINALPYINLIPVLGSTLNFFASFLNHFIPQQSAAAPSLTA